jgi:ADP-heptose:LPS heptosyltransferase
MRKILVISLAGIGDTLLATPLLHELRLNFPQAVLDVFVMWPGARELLEGNPHVTTVHQQNLLKAGALANLRFLRRLRAQQYDVSLNTYPQSKIHYRFTTRVIGAPRRLSHVYDRWSALDGRLVSDTVPQDYALHSVQNNLNLLPLLGASPKLPAHDSEIYLTPAETQWARQWLDSHQLAGRKLLGIHVGSGKTKNLELRRWPLTSYVELLRHLQAGDRHLAVLLFGGPEEKADHEILLRATGSAAVQVAGSRTLRQAAALLQHCHAFLSVDTALMHLAAAVKVPAQVVIETPTFNKTIEPHNRPYVLVRNPMVAGRNLEYYRYDGRGIQGAPEHLQACMRSVTVEAVLKELKSLL